MHARVPQLQRPGQRKAHTVNTHCSRSAVQGSHQLTWGRSPRGLRPVCPHSREPRDTQTQPEASAAPPALHTEPQTSRDSFNRHAEGSVCACWCGRATHVHTHGNSASQPASQPRQTPEALNHSTHAHRTKSVCSCPHSAHPTLRTQGLGGGRVGSQPPGPSLSRRAGLAALQHAHLMVHGVPGFV